MKRVILWGSALLALVIVDLLIWKRWQGRQGEARYDSIIHQAARQYEIDPLLVKAVVWRESRFKATARGQAQEIGLMQLREAAASEWAAAEKIEPFAHELVLDPRTNTLAGTWYLAKLLKRYQQTDDPLPYALADYNAGRRNVLRWMTGPGETNATKFLQKMDFPGTRDYIRQVRNRYQHYQEEAE